MPQSREEQVQLALRVIALTCAGPHREFLIALAGARGSGVLALVLELLERIPAIPERRLLAAHVTLRGNHERD
jgi:hypothetical protein